MKARESNNMPETPSVDAAPDEPVTAEEPAASSDADVSGEPAAAGEPAAPSEPAAPGEAQLVPTWLALLVLALLLAVVGVGGYVIRGFVAGDRRATSPEEVAVRQALKNVAKQPSSADAHLSLGYAYQEAKRYDKALEEYSKVLQIDPQSTAAYYNRGVVYSALQLNDKAEEAWWDVLAIDKTHELAAKRLGEMYAAKGQYRSLIRAVRPVVTAHPEMADLQYLMGVAYENMGKTDWALSRYRLAVKYAPDIRGGREAIKRLESQK